MGRIVASNGQLVDIGEFECSPATGGATKTELEVVTYCVRTFSRNGILDSLTESVDISVYGIFTDGDDVAGRVSVVYWKIWLKEAKFLNSPTCVNNLYSIPLASSSL
jgi:hypothetical protein